MSIQPKTIRGENWFALILKSGEPSMAVKTLDEAEILLCEVWIWMI